MDNNTIASLHPELVSEWHPTKNSELVPSKVAPYSNKKVWWICPKGHEWEAVIASRSKGAGCPYCAGIIAITGVNDLATTYPKIASQWHPYLNEPVLPTHEMPQSNKKFWWLGSCGHEWKNTVYARTAGSGCPYCAGKLVLSGYNDLETTYPQLALEWHPSKNGDLLPCQVTKGSHKKVWWKCKSGHEWFAEIKSRANGCGCPYCAGQRLLQGINDLATRNPECATEWHPTKNGSLHPSDVTISSNRKVWWLGKCGHEWLSSICDRTGDSRHQTGCPYCSGRLVLTGFNDLASTNPLLAKEWLYEKNGNLTPDKVTVSSNKKVWWKCTIGHEWITSINSRTQGRGCPICANEQKTSFPEQSIYYYLSKITKAKNRFLLNGKTEIDVYLPDFKIGIEYDGLIYHNSNEATKRDSRKNNVLRADGVKLIRVKEYEKGRKLKDTEDTIYCINSGHYSYLNDVMKKILVRIEKITGLRFNIDINIERDIYDIHSIYIKSIKSNSLLECSPELVAEWHPEKNGELKPSMFTRRSGKKSMVVMQKWT